jgi:hypothetical protein
MKRAATSHVGATHSGIGLGTVPIDLTMRDGLVWDDPLALAAVA